MLHICSQTCLHLQSLQFELFISKMLKHEKIHLFQNKEDEKNLYELLTL